MSSHVAAGCCCVVTVLFDGQECQTYHRQRECGGGLSLVKSDLFVGQLLVWRHGKKTMASRWMLQMGQEKEVVHHKSHADAAVGNRSFVECCYGEALG